jgi:hypothetical protein
MRKGFLIYDTSPYMRRRPLVIYDLATAPFCISLYMRKILLSFFISASQPREVQPPDGERPSKDRHLTDLAAAQHIHQQHQFVAAAAVRHISGRSVGERTTQMFGGVLRWRGRTGREMHAVRPPGAQLHLAAGRLRAVRGQGHQGAGEPENKKAWFYNTFSVGIQDILFYSILLVDCVQYKDCSVVEECKIYLK